MLDRDTGCRTPLFGYFWLPMNQPVYPFGLAGSPFWSARWLCPIHALDTKIFLTIFYECRYKLSCIVNVNGARLARAGS